jgi:hypothetical protein
MDWKWGVIRVFRPTAPNGNILAGAAFQGAPANAARQGFGVISSTAIPMRQLQLGLKYSF